MPAAQAALHQRPELEATFLLVTMIAVAFTILGGLLGDVLRRRQLLLSGLLGMVVAELGSAAFDTGPLFLASRLLAAAATGIILPVALAIVAVTYTGGARATALGIVYALLGGATATAPAILLTVQPHVGRWPAFLLAALCALIVLPLARRFVPETSPAGLRVADVAGHGLWALGLLMVTGGIVGISSNPASPIRWSLIGAGLLLIGGFLVWQRRRQDAADDAAIDVRPVTVALIAGVVIAVAQTAPAVQAPLFFQIANGMGSLRATIAIAPFVLALLVSGPLAGLLLARWSPRALIVGGLLVVGLGDIGFALAGPDTFYPWFILPLAAIGAGFVVGTCVRTAVIFASVPRKLPATAAGLNQSSLMLGGQIGVAAVTAIVGGAAVASFTASAQAAGGDVQSAVAGFKGFIDAVGTSTMGQAISGLSDSVRAGYGAAYAAGVSQALFTVGGAAVLGAVTCWLLMGRSVPLTSVWEHRDERGDPTPTAPVAAATD
jgi:DHA2 family methylenomycin A resistance protein-like MFS transporter